MLDAVVSGTEGGAGATLPVVPDDVEGSAELSLEVALPDEEAAELSDEEVPADDVATLPEELAEPEDEPEEEDPDDDDVSVL